jgi:GTPase SAR1 family protein
MDIFFYQIKEVFLQKILNLDFNPDTKINILLLGQAASGKSSFINSSRTALRQDGIISGIAPVLDGISDSLTRKVNVRRDIQ